MLFREAAIAALGLASASALSLDAKLQKRDGAGHSHDHGHASADSGYGAPVQSYEEPAASYGAPAASYGAPAASYGAPAASYGAPSDSYGVSYGGYEEQDQFPDITPIIIGLLVLAGLSLLFPTFVSLQSVRKRRDAEDGNSNAELLGSALPKLPSPGVYYGLLLLLLRSTAFTS